MYLSRREDLNDLEISIRLNQACFGDRISWLCVLITDGSRDFAARRSCNHLCWDTGNFGSGFNRQPEDGGFNEVAARNAMLAQAAALHRLTPVDWVVWCDSDEYFCRPPELDDLSADLLLVITNHLVARFPENDLTGSWLAKACPQLPLVYAEQDNPHPRAVRAASLPRLYWRENRHLPPAASNRTQHCVLAVKAGRPLIPAVDEHAHVHFGSLLDQWRQVPYEQLFGYHRLEPQLGPPFKVQAGVYHTPETPRPLLVAEPVEKWSDNQPVG